MSNESSSRPRILIVDDEPSVGHAFRLALAPIAARLEIALSVAEGTRLLTAGNRRTDSWDLVISDLYLPAESGLDLLRFINGANLDVAFILLTGRPNPDDIAASVRLGMADLLIKPVSVRNLRDAVARNYQLLHQRRAQHTENLKLHQQIEQLTRDAGEAALRVTSLETAVVEALLSALAAREIDTVAHSRRVQAYTRFLASAAAYPEPLRPHLERAALLHDIGKLGLSDWLMSRSGPLTAAELLRLQPHAALGEEILARIDFLRPAAHIVRHHHERFDGTGFPDGLSGEAIPLGARIFAIADALDAITSEHIHRKAGSFEAASAAIADAAGTQFDPHLVDCFLGISLTTWHHIRTQVQSQTHEPWPG